MISVPRETIRFDVHSWETTPCDRVASHGPLRLGDDGNL